MSENQKFGKPGLEKSMTRYDKKIQKRKEEEQKERRKNQINRIITFICLAAVIALVIYFPARNYSASRAAYINVGGYEVTEVEFDYYYRSGINDYISQYGAFLSYIGLDVTQDFSQQPYSDNLTWADFFQQNAVNALKRTKALLIEAKAAGFEYNADAEVENQINAIKEAAKSAEAPLNDYIKSYFGKYATIKNIRPFVEESYFASAYYAQIAETKQASEEEITAYYQENKVAYDSVDYRVIEVVAEIPAGEETTDAEGNKVTADPTQEQIDAAMETAAAEAEKKLDVLDTEGLFKENMKSASIPVAYHDWLFDEARKAGDTTVVEDSTNNKYLVLKFEERYLDDVSAVNIRVILSTQGNADAIVEEWKNTGADEAAFIAVVEKYSEDLASTTKGGLYEDLQATDQNEDLRTWMLDESRQPGDVEAITSTDGNTYILYYVSQGRPGWQVSVSNTLLSNAMNEYVTGLVEVLEVSDPKGNLNYLNVLEEISSESENTEGATEPSETEQSTETQSSNG